MANFEAFYWNFSSSINLFSLKSFSACWLPTCNWAISSMQVTGMFIIHESWSIPFQELKYLPKRYCTNRNALLVTKHVWSSWQRLWNNGMSLANLVKAPTKFIKWKVQLSKFNWLGDICPWCRAISWSRNPWLKLSAIVKIKTCNRRDHSMVCFLGIIINYK